MKYAYLIFITLVIISLSCSKTNDDIDNSNCTPNGETFVINAGDANYYTLNLCAEQTYTLSFDFSNHNFDSDGGEKNGWRQNYEIDWEIETKQYSFEVGNKLKPEIYLPKSSICFTPKKNMKVKFKILDSNYSDNTGSVIVNLGLGSIGFNGNDSISIGPRDDSFHTVSFESNTNKTINFDYSNYNYNSNSEPNGWRHHYEIDWGISTKKYSFEVGNRTDPIVFIPKSSITLKPVNSIDINIRVFDTSYGDNAGNVIVTY